jgi:hypothetical protein
MLAQDSCAPLCALSESSGIQGVKIHAHVADFYEIYYISVEEKPI